MRVEVDRDVVVGWTESGDPVVVSTISAIEDGRASWIAVSNDDLDDPERRETLERLVGARAAA